MTRVTYLRSPVASTPAEPVSEPFRTVPCRTLQVLHPQLARANRDFMSKALQAPGAAHPPPVLPWVFPARFGIEIEMLGITLVEAAHLVAQELHGSVEPFAALRGAYRVRDLAGRLWEVKPDCDAVEIATPILSDPADLNMVQRVARRLRDAAATGDDETGLHIHVDGKAFTPANLAHLLAMVSRHESFLYPALQVIGSRQNIYCQPLRAALVRDVIAAHPKDMADFVDLYRRGNREQRWASVNLENLVSDGKGSIEFRLFNSTLDAAEIGCHVGLVMALAERALASPQFPTLDEPEAPPSLPHLLTHLGFDASDPISRRLCQRWVAAIVADLDSASQEALLPVLEAEGYAGDVSLLLANGIAPDAIFATLERLDCGDRAAFFQDAVSLLKLSADRDYRRAAYDWLTRATPRERQRFFRKAADLLQISAQHGTAAAMLQTLQEIPLYRLPTWIMRWDYLPPRLLVSVHPDRLGAVMSDVRAMGLAQADDAITPELLRAVADATPAVREAVIAAGAALFARHVTSSSSRVAMILRLLALPPQTILAVTAAMARAVHLCPDDACLRDMVGVLIGAPNREEIVDRLLPFYADGLVDRFVAEAFVSLSEASILQTRAVYKEAAALWRPPMRGMVRSERLAVLLGVEPGRLAHVTAPLTRILRGQRDGTCFGLLVSLLEGLQPTHAAAVAAATEALSYPGLQGHTLYRQVSVLAAQAEADLGDIVRRVLQACLADGIAGDDRFVTLCRICEWLPTP